MARGFRTNVIGGGTATSKYFLLKTTTYDKVFDVVPYEWYRSYDSPILSSEKLYGTRTGSGDGDREFRISNAIDFTKYSKLCIRYSNTRDSSLMHILIGTSKGGSNLLNYGFPTSSATTLAVFDISNINTNGYISYYGKMSGHVLYSIWLEK